MADLVTRRSFLRVLGAASTGLLAAACGPAAAPQPTAAPAKPAAPAQSAPASGAAPAAAPPAVTFDQLYEAAKKDGKVVVQTPAGAGYRPSLDAFMKQFPGIEADHQAFPDAATYLPKIASERQAGIFSIDVLNTTVTPLLQFLKPEGTLDPIKPLIVLPEALDDKAWYGGLDARWADLTKTHVFRHQVTVIRPIYVNTNLAREDEVKTIDDLLDPKWKGKIVTSDLVQGYVYTPGTVLRETKGEAWLRKLFVDQEPQIIRDRRQAIETLIRGGAPIGFGLHPVVMGDFVKDGLAGHIKNPEVEGATYGGGDVVAIYNKAPHPAAAKLYINWLLSKEGQAAHASSVRQNSARLDVPAIDPATAPGTGKIVDPSNEEWITKNAETQEFLKGLKS